MLTTVSIVKFLANEATPEERKAIFEQLQHDHSNQQVFDLHNTLWTLVENTGFSNEFSAEKITESLKKLVAGNK